MLSRDFAKHFADVMRKHRKAKRLTQEALAEKSDLAEKMISLIERHLRNPSVNAADSIAQGLGVPLSKLVTEAEILRQKDRARKS